MFPWQCWLLLRISASRPVLSLTGCVCLSYLWSLGCSPDSKAKVWTLFTVAGAIIGSWSVQLGCVGVSTSISLIITCENAAAQTLNCSAPLVFMLLHICLHMCPYYLYCFSTTLGFVLIEIMCLYMFGWIRMWLIIKRNKGARFIYIPWWNRTLGVLITKEFIVYI